MAHTSDGGWKTPKSDSLEEFVFFVMKAARRLVWLLILVALAIYAVRYGLAADLQDPPWDSLPIVGKAPG